ncbi:hypothetical protein [Echinimonas agarilytica]|uniref:Uncharacterized protein n=1 Tax=Echinimonas agarilytica TaxID=1215918 RepID=A0AA41W8D1_9GAMM|nr:hypothetical protein [Echinimonas agarilytica]MCM2680387.1 hypothetical protein [Echinimonas agarilytica]
MSWSALSNECQHELSEERFDYVVQVELTGSCSRGMYVLGVKAPQGQQQTLYQAYTAAISGLWLERLTGQSAPDIVMTAEFNGKLEKLQVFSWKEGYYSERWLEPPSAEQLSGYVGQDKVYVRWNTLVRQIKTKNWEGESWRRLVYDFAKERWQTDTSSEEEAQ